MIASGGGFSTIPPSTRWSSQPIKETCRCRLRGSGCWSIAPCEPSLPEICFPSPRPSTASTNIFKSARPAISPVCHCLISAFDLWNFGPALQWELDVWGRFRRRIEQADAEVEAEVELYDDILSIAVADTAKAYVNFRTAQEFVRLARQNVEIQQGSLKLAETRFKEGATSELDVTQAQSTLHAKRRP